MKHILDKNTGELLYATKVDVKLNKNEIAVDEALMDWMLKPFYNFETKEYYETATQEEIDEYNKQFE